MSMLISLNLAENANQKLDDEKDTWGQRGSSVAVIRYGVTHSSTANAGGAPQ